MQPLLLLLDLDEVFSSDRGGERRRNGVRLHDTFAREKDGLKRRAAKALMKRCGHFRAARASCM